MRRIHTKPRQVNEIKTEELLVSLHDFQALSMRWKELQTDGWQLFVTEQNRGYCNITKRHITVPLWAITKGLGAGYWIYYLAHEFAHTNTNDIHGPKFMQEFLKLCPPEYQHYELGYKPQQAKVAGISLKDADKAKDVKLTSFYDCL